MWLCEVSCVYLAALLTGSPLPLSSYPSLCFCPEGSRGSLLVIGEGRVEAPSRKIEIKLTNPPILASIFSKGETLTLNEIRNFDFYI